MYFSTTELVDFYSLNRPTPEVVAHRMGGLLGIMEDQIPENIVDMLCDLIHPKRPSTAIPTLDYPKEMAVLMEAYLAGIAGKPVPHHRSLPPVDAVA